MKQTDVRQPSPATSARSGLRRRTWWAVAAASALAGAGAAAWRLRPRDPDEGAVNSLWGLGFESPQGPELKLAEWKGQMLLINFWATWCPPCVEELPMLNAFHARQRSRGWQVVGLAVDQMGSVQSFLNRLPLQFPVGVAGLAGAELSRSLGNATGGLPFTVLLDRSGAIAQRKLGKLAQADLDAWAKG